MNFEKNTVYSLKLNSGEELIAKVVSSEFGRVTVSHPVSMAPSQQGLQMIPSLFSADLEKSVDINITSIAMSATAREDVVKAYTESTTGLDLSASNQMLAG